MSRWHTPTQHLTEYPPPHKLEDIHQIPYTVYRVYVPSAVLSGLQHQLDDVVFMKSSVKNDNQKIVNECDDVDNRRKCNCRNNDLYPFDGECLTATLSWLSEATVTTTSDETKTYIETLLKWQRTISKQDTITTNSLSRTENIRMTLYFQSTSGT